MYEQAETPGLRRILWILLSCIVAIAVLWTLGWLVFFRHTASKTPTLHGSNSSSNGSSDSSDDSSSSDSASTGQPAPGTDAGPAPTQLANTGAGNILVPFAVASVAGGALYYIRLRRKVLS